MQAALRAVKDELVAMGAVIRNDGDAASDTNQELVTLAVCVFATRLLAWNVKNYKVPPDREWDAALELANTQAATHVRDARKRVQSGMCGLDLRGFFPASGNFSRVVCCIDVADDAGGTADDDRVGRYGSGNDCSGTDHRVAPHRNAGEQNG